MTRDSHIVVLDQTHQDGTRGCATFRCNNCGMRVAIRLPVAVSEWTGMADSFVSRHRDCSIVAPEVSE